MDSYSDDIHIGRYKVRGGPIILQKYQRNTLIRANIRCGYTQAEVARMFGISNSRVREILMTHYPKLYKEIKQPEKSHNGIGKKPYRNYKMYSCYSAGYSLTRIANIFKISPGRTHQIIKSEVIKNKNNNIHFSQKII